MVRWIVQNDLAIKARDLAKSYGSKEAVRGVSLEAPRSVLYGFLGPNGAGNTIKKLTGFVR